MRDEQFEELLQGDLGWRKREISELWMIIKGNDSKILLKSMILILYAHWEGYIKKSTKIYLKYVSEKNVHIKDLHVNFQGIVLKKHAQQCMEEESLTLTRELSFVDKYSKMLTKKFKINIDPDNDFDEDVINTHHNLSPKVLKNISKVIGVEYSSALATREIYINSYLLANRNIIGHGSKYKKKEEINFDLCAQDVEKLKEFIIIVLDFYCELLMDYVANQYYLVVNADDMSTYNRQKELELQRKLEELEDKSIISDLEEM